MKNDLDFLEVLTIIFSIIMIVCIVAVIVLEICLWKTYGAMPISEIPSWILFFMFGGK